MKLLLFTPQLPYPPHQGTTIRNYHLICHLARHHTIDLVSFLAPDQTLTAENPLYRYCRRIITAPQPVRTLKQRARTLFSSPLPDMALRLESAAMHALVNDLTDRYDLLQIEGIEMAQYGLAAYERLTAGACSPRLIFDDHNCEYLLQKRNALTDLRTPRRWVAGLYSLVQWAKLRRYEAQICRAADVVTAVSGPDRDALATLAPDTPIAVVANGIAPLDGPPATMLRHGEEAPTLLFTGKMDYRPNIDAVLWFSDEVLPLIQAAAPTVRFQIVGMNPHPRLDRLRANPAIVITGAVPSVTPYLTTASLYVVPLRVGGGTRFKVLEAMAHGLPIVSTPLGVEGIGVTDQAELLVAATPTAFADAVLRLLADQQMGGALGQQLGQRARTFVEAHYSWETIVPQLEALYQN
jgi:glycosyltransferase involved in cell wall biosynthesis